MRITLVIDCIGLGFGVLVVEDTARVLNSTFHWLFRQDKDHSFLQVWAQEAHMVIMSRAFAFLNRDIGAERATIEEMRDITCVLKPWHSRACKMDFGNHVVMRI
jgi:hypothetical protein